MTLNGVVAVILPYFTEFNNFGAGCITVVEVRPVLSAAEI